MSTLKTEARLKPKRIDPYGRVTDLIIEHLENGVVPWRCPWNRDAGRPRNFHTGKEYQGVNLLLLGLRFTASPWWMTFRQAQERGGRVRRGEHGTPAVKYGAFNAAEPGDEKDRDGDETESRRGMYLRAFTVFNAAQIEGIAFPEPAPGETLSADRRIEKAEAIVRGMPRPPVIRDGCGIRACYRPARDEIEMPPFRRFSSGGGYYLTLFHELAHATGHPSRLNRDTLTGQDGFGGKIYSLEELTAETAAAFLGMEAGIVQDRHGQSAAYLSGWLSVLKVRDHRRWIVQAASRASRAADFILGRGEEDDREQEEPAGPDAPV